MLQGGPARHRTHRPLVTTLVTSLWIMKSGRFEYLQRTELKAWEVLSLGNLVLSITSIKIPKSMYYDRRESRLTCNQSLWHVYTLREDILACPVPSRLSNLIRAPVVKVDLASSSIGKLNWYCALMATLVPRRGQEWTWHWAFLKVGLATRAIQTLLCKQSAGHDGWMRDRHACLATAVSSEKAYCMRRGEGVGCNR